MGMFDFIQDAGEKIFGGSKKEETMPEAPRGDMKVDEAMSRALTSMAQGSGLPADSLHVQFEAGRATLQGRVSCQADCEKLVLLVGNTQGVSQVADHLKIDPSLSATPPPPEAEAKATFYTVQAGDTLSKIAQQHYGKAGKYTVIFAANQPMLKNPDRIYPGQTLRIPMLTD